MSAEKTDKIAEIETIMAHQERVIQELNDVVTHQADEIDRLKKYMKMTSLKLTELEQNINDKSQEKITTLSEEAAANKPPHY